MFDLFETQFKAIGSLRVDKRLSTPYLTQFVNIMILMEQAYSFDNLGHLIGREVARQKSSMITDQDMLQCSIDAFNIIDSINTRFNYDFVTVSIRS